MKLVEKILRRAYRDRTEFSAAEVEFAGAIIAAYNEEREARGKKSSLPTKFVPVGEEVTVSGRRFLCIAAEKVGVPSEACSGCSLSKLYLGCGDLQCGPFDRRDKRFVWFKEVGTKVGTNERKKK